jgi:hypothetical protein
MSEKPPTALPAGDERHNADALWVAAQYLLIWNTPRVDGVGALGERWNNLDLAAGRLKG